jgi:hypothetical protein
VRFLRENSLSMLLMTTIFLLSWFGQSVNGWRAFNNTRDAHGSAYDDYLLNWRRTKSPRPLEVGYLERQCAKAL